MRQPRPILFWLCVGWTALVWSVLAWQAIHYSGVFRWLAEWQIAHAGHYRTKLTLLIVGFALTGPALHWLGVNERFRQRQEAAAHDPAAKTVRARMFSFWMAAIAGFIAIFSLLTLQKFPSANAEPVEINLAHLGAGEPPLGRAILIGEVDTQQSVVTDQTSRYYQIQSAYFPIRPPGDTSGPVRFVVDRSVLSYSTQTPRAQHFFLTNRVQGSLLRNGLPGQARAAFEKSHIPLADPHYLLTTSSQGGRDPYIVAAILGAVMAFLFLMVSIFQTRIIARARSDDFVLEPEHDR